MTYVVIPFRKGSKRVKNKNIREFNGLPLFLHTYKQALIAFMNKDDTTIILKTDYEEKFIIKLMTEHGFTAIPKKVELCIMDHTPDNEPATFYIDHIIDKYSANSKDDIVLLQPTCPSRSVQDIWVAVGVYRDSEATHLVSVQEVGPLCKLYGGDNESGKIRSISGVDLEYNRGKDKVEIRQYRRNSSIYIFNVGAYLKTGSIFNSITDYLVMPWWRCIDIDTEDDFYVAEKFAKAGVDSSWI